MIDRRSLMIAGAGLAVPGLARAALGPVVKDDPRFDKVTAYLDAGYQSLKLPGAGLLVWKDGKTLYERYFGTYGPDTVVPIASSSKWLSAATMMTVVDEGKLSLDDSPAKYFPAFTGEKAQITIRQMFSHSSGLMGPGRQDLNWPYTITMAEYAQRMAGPDGRMEAEPGTEIRYGSSSMQVVGAICEKVTGKAWNDLFLERIAGPCGMATTTYVRQKENTNPMLAGGAVSSMTDYGRYLEMIAGKGTFRGKRVLSAKAVKEMQTDQTRAAPLKVASNDRMGRLSHYGLGEWIDEEDAGGRTHQVSSPGAFGFRPWYNLDRNLYGVFLMKRDLGGAAMNQTFDPWKLIDMVHAAADRRG